MATATAAPRIDVTKPFTVAQTQVQTRQAGDGAVVPDTATVSVCYMGVNGRDGSVFDSSYERQAPFEYNFGQSLIAGWDIGMADARKGLKRRLVIPGSLGYGERGNARAKIPPNATLVFSIDVLSITAAPPPPAAADPAAQPQPVQAQPVQAQPVQEAKPAEAKPEGSKADS